MRRAVRNGPDCLFLRGGDDSARVADIVGKGKLDRITLDLPVFWILQTSYCSGMCYTIFLRPSFCALVFYVLTVSYSPMKIIFLDCDSSKVFYLSWVLDMLFWTHTHICLLLPFSDIQKCGVRNMECNPRNISDAARLTTP